MKITEVNKFYILILLFLAQFTLDINTNKCINRTDDELDKQITDSDKYKIITILFLHHAISVFTNFGWIFNNRTILKIYLLFPVLAILHWVTNDDKCFLTEMVNKICGYKQYKVFNDFTYFLKIKPILPLIKVLGIIIALYKINSSK
jgi:hypothetical protein